MRKKNENFIAVYPQNNHYLRCCNSQITKICPNISVLLAKMAVRALDKKYFKRQMNYIVLVQIGNHFIQFKMTFLIRPSTKATQPVLLF